MLRCSAVDFWGTIHVESPGSPRVGTTKCHEQRARTRKPRRDRGVLEMCEASEVAVCCSVLPCVAGCCRVLQCVAACCSVLQLRYAKQANVKRVAVCCSVLQCVAVC